MTASDSDAAGNSGNRTDCGLVCTQGCCTSKKCCDIQSSITIQIVSMLGSFVILVSVVLFCYVRYRCYHKHLQNMVARQEQDESRPGHAHYVSAGSTQISVSTVQVPSPDNFGTRLGDLSSTNLHNLLHIILRSEVQPPPYTENDPLACPSSDRFFAAGLCSPASSMVQPPAYSDVIKENEAGGELLGNNENNGQNV